MRHAAVGVLCLAGVVLVLNWMGRGDAQAQAPLATVKPLVLSDGLIAVSSDTAEGRQQVVVIESKTRVMSVYHIEHKTGVITLKSVRSIAADLELDEFNTDSPLPREIRAMINKR